jgi:hypothetical protein
MAQRYGLQQYVPSCSQQAIHDDVRVAYSVDFPLPNCGAMEGSHCSSVQHSRYAQIVAGDEKCPCCLPSPHGYEKYGIVAHE